MDTAFHLSTLRWIRVLVTRDERRRSRLSFRTRVPVLENTGSSTYSQSILCSLIIRYASGTCRCCAADCRYGRAALCSVRAIGLRRFQSESLSIVFRSALCCSYVVQGTGYYGRSSHRSICCIHQSIRYFECRKKADLDPGIWNFSRDFQNSSTEW